MDPIAKVPFPLVSTHSDAGSSPAVSEGSHRVEGISDPDSGSELTSFDFVTLFTPKS